MAKAILKMEMPENCWQCELYSTAHNCCNVIVIVGHYAICPSKGRRPDCPLKLVEENVIAAWNSRTGNDIVVRGEWIPIFKGSDTCECSVCKSEGVRDSDFGFIATPYCPNCGAKMESEVKHDA